ncbi:MAG: tetratricopeptide repeat protein [Candidatus Hodarchaeota archaeon]
MLSNTLKEFVEEGKCQEGLDLLAQKEKRGIFSSLSKDEQVKCRYYQIQALNALGQFEEALQLARNSCTTFEVLKDNVLLLMMQIAQLSVLINLGQINEAVKARKKGEEIIACLTDSERSTGAHWLALFENIRGNIYYFKGMFDKALDCHQQALVFHKANGNKKSVADTLKVIGAIYHRKGMLDKALDHYNQSLTLNEEIGNKKSVGVCLSNIGAIYGQKGDIDRALEFFQRSLSLHKDNKNKQDISRCLFNIGNVYRFKGMLTTALDYFQQSLALDIEIGNKQEIAMSLNNIGLIYRQKGELDLALDYYQRGLTLLEEIGNKQEIAMSLDNIGLIYNHKGMFDLALDFYQRGLTLFKEVGNDLSTALILFSLILLSLDQQDLTKSRSYLTELKEVQKRIQNKRIHLRSRLAEGLVLKRDKWMKSKAQAQIILEQLVSEEPVEFELTALAMIHLCDLLIIEFKAFGVPEVWEKAKNLISKLDFHAQEQQEYATISEVLLLKARFAIIEGDLQQALEYFDQARLNAEAKKMPLLVKKIDTEKKIFEEEFLKWQELIQRNTSIQERLKEVFVESYIQKAIEAFQQISFQQSRGRS